MKQNINFNFLIILFLVGLPLANAQKQLIIVSKSSKSPIAFAEIKTAKNTGFYTNELGEFTLADSIKSITVRMLGFEEKTIQSKQLRDTIKLKEKAIPISEIVVKETAKKQLEIPIKKRDRFFGSLLLNDKQELILVAIPHKIASDRKITTLSGLVKKQLFIHDKKSRAKKQLIGVKTIIRINIYTVKDGFFTDKIYSSKPLKIETFSGGKFTLDLSKEAIYFNKEGLAFAIEYIGIVSPNKKLSKKRQYIKVASTHKQNKYYKATTYLKYTFKDVENITPINDFINSSLHEGVKPNFDVNLTFGFVLD